MSREALRKAYQVYPAPRALIVVNLYGQSADYDLIKEIAGEHGTPIIEDAAESLGATYKGVQTGALGDIGIFSFNGNKIITTSGGGMLVCNDEEIVKKARFWATQPVKLYRGTSIMKSATITGCPIFAPASGEVTEGSGRENC